MYDNESTYHQDRKQDQIIIRSVRRPRHDWDALFSAMAAQGDDQLVDGEVLRQSSWDEAEWEW